MKYPIELELTDICALKCMNCINSQLDNKSYMSLEIFSKILQYISSNKHNVLYLNLSWIGDVFLHPEFSKFIDLLCEKIWGTKIDILIPSKWQSYNSEILKSLKKIQNSGLKLNVSVWFFSLIPSKHNKIVWHSTGFEKTMDFMKALKYHTIPFSIELATDDTKELKYLNKIANIFEVWYSIQWVHNFGGHFEDKLLPRVYNQCSFHTDNEYILDWFYCPFIPLISKDWYIYPCSISWKKEIFFYKKIDYFYENDISFYDMIFMIKKFLWNGEKCKNCSVFKLSKWIEKSSS